jgi:hypothetical protein
VFIPSDSDSGEQKEPEIQEFKHPAMANETVDLDGEDYTIDMKSEYDQNTNRGSRKATQGRQYENILRKES